MQPDLAIKMQIRCLRCAHLIVILPTIGFMCARFLPGPSPLSTAAEIAARYANNFQGIRIGMTLMLLSSGFYAVWGGVLATWTRRVEGGKSLLADIQIACIAVGTIITVMAEFFWLIAAFRPGVIAPDITMTLNDMGWLMFLLPWPPYSVWCIALALAILRDQSEFPLLPRWSAGLSFLTAFLFMPASATIFFKSGGFAYNGLLGMFLPLVMFLVWLEGITIPMTLGLKRELRRQQA